MLDGQAEGVKHQRRRMVLPTIDRISRHGMPDRSEMNADLMGSSGTDHYGQQRKIPILPEHVPFGDGFLALTQRTNGEFLSVLALLTIPVWIVPSRSRNIPSAMAMYRFSYGVP